MVQLNDFPDLGKEFEGLKIACDLNDIKGDGLISYSVRQLLAENKTRRAVDLLLKIAKDNRQHVIDLIGEDLLKRIEKFS